MSPAPRRAIADVAPKPRHGTFLPGALEAGLRRSRCALGKFVDAAFVSAAMAIHCNSAALFPCPPRYPPPLAPAATGQPTARSSMAPEPGEGAAQ